MDPVPPHSALAQLLSSTRIDMGHRTPVFDPMKLCAAKPSDTAPAPRPLSIFNKKDKDEPDEAYDKYLQQG